MSARSPFEQALLEAVHSKEKALACRIAMAFRPLRCSKGEVAYRAAERFHAASTMKVPVMIEVFRQAEAGRFALSDTLEVDPRFRSLHDGSEFEVRGRYYDDRRIGQRATIRELTEKMIVVSDDLATNLLITLCGPEEITAIAQSLGATQTTVLRCVEDLASFRAGGMNWVTAHDLNTLFEAIEDGRAASDASCAEMRQILLAQELNNMIPAKLPAGTPVGHKTGAITGVRHDAGIVYAPSGPFCLALLCDGLSDPAEGIEAIADLSRLIYERWEEAGGEKSPAHKEAP